MSAFLPVTFAEATARYKPLKRSKVSNASREIKARPGGGRARKTARKKKAKKLTDGQLKKRVWKEFSMFVRTQGADPEGLNTCFTCGVRKHWKELHAGHFVRGRLNANLFDGRGCKPQCYSCNVGKQGNVIPYYKRMLKQYGQMVIDALVTQNNNTRKWQAGELLNLLDHYKALNSANPLIDRKSQRFAGG